MLELDFFSRRLNLYVQEKLCVLVIYRFLVLIFSEFYEEFDIF